MPLGLTRSQIGGHYSGMCVYAQVDPACWYTATLCITQRHTATHCNTLHHDASHCITLQHTALCKCWCRWVRQDASHSSTLQHTATHCNTLQNTATHCSMYMLIHMSLMIHYWCWGRYGHTPQRWRASVATTTMWQLWLWGGYDE